MKILVDMDKCICAGLCVTTAPKIFAQNEDDGLVIVLDETPPLEQFDAACEAARLCPALAIKVESGE
jgi:ferredoxin